MYMYFPPKHVFVFPNACIFTSKHVYMFPPKACMCFSQRIYIFPQSMYVCFPPKNVFVFPNACIFTSKRVCVSPQSVYVFFPAHMCFPRWPRDTLYQLKLALTSPTGCGRSVGIVRLRTKTTEFFFHMCFTSKHVHVFPPKACMCLSQRMYIFPQSMYMGSPPKHVFLI
jgi:hypothetical protein